MWNFLVALILPPLSPLQVSVSTAGVVAQIMLWVTGSPARLYRFRQSVLLKPVTKAVRSWGETGPVTVVRPHPLILSWIPTKS
jgi:hypothetical protein